MKKVSLGIIGCGVIGKTHITGAQKLPQVELAAICDIREDAARAVAAEFKVAKYLSDPDAMLADPTIDAVILALPLKGRTDLAVKAFAKGKHVLIEKPAARNVAEIKRLISHRGDRVAALASARMRHYDSYKAIEKVFKSGVLGKIRSIRSRGIKQVGPTPKNPPPVWRVNKELNGGGILVNWGVYDLDYLLGLTGWSVRPRTVLAQTWQVGQPFTAYVAPGSDAETHFNALIRCDGGETFNIERGEFIPCVNDEAWQIIGEKGSLRLSMVPEGAKKMWLDQATPTGVESKVIWEGEETWEMLKPMIVEDFVEAILQKRPPATTLENALMIQQITDAIYASAEQKKAITIE